MKTTPIKTKIYSQELDLVDFIVDHAGPQIKERSLLAVTSKIVSLAEGRIIPADKVDKKELVERESDHYLGEIGYGCHLTIKHGLFIPSAGIDESNVDGDFLILYPEDPVQSAKGIWQALRERLSLNELGVILTDSHTIPLRQGVIGVALSYWGFKGLCDKVGDKDLFGRELKMTKIDVADALAVAATLMMGEGAESSPLAIIEQAPVEFTDQCDPGELTMPIEEDLYYPIYQHIIKE